MISFLLVVEYVITGLSLALAMKEDFPKFIICYFTRSRCLVTRNTGLSIFYFVPVLTVSLLQGINAQNLVTIWELFFLVRSITCHSY